MPNDLNTILQPRPDFTRQLKLGTDDAKGLGLQRGDLLLIDTSIAPEFGDIVVANISGRWRPRLLQRMSGRIILTAKTFSTPDNHFEVWSQLDLLGVVTFSIHACAGTSRNTNNSLRVRPTLRPIRT
jgi:DNA polymerase V